MASLIAVAVIAALIIALAVVTIVRRARRASSLSARERSEIAAEGQREHHTRDADAAVLRARNAAGSGAPQARSRQF